MKRLAAVSLAALAALSACAGQTSNESPGAGVGSAGEAVMTLTWRDSCPDLKRVAFEPHAWTEYICEMGASGAVVKTYVDVFPHTKEARGHMKTFVKVQRDFIVAQGDDWFIWQNTELAE